VLVLLGVLFAVFTFVTPKLGIFCDPLTGTYGITEAVPMVSA